MRILIINLIAIINFTSLLVFMISPLLASLKSTSKRFNFAVLQNENEEAFAREENQLRTESNWIIIIKNALVLF